MATRGFTGRPRTDDGRVPPGQYVVEDFPVLTAGPTVGVTEQEWELTVGDGNTTKTYDWKSLHALPIEAITVDIHCVTHWTKLDTEWEGVRVSTLFEDADVGDYDFALISSYGDYTTNLPVSDLVDHDALIATKYDGEPLDAEHGGPARLVVPHLYFWKSAKWVRHIRLADEDEPGFWEAAGYHSYGDPWHEQRYYAD